jgi:hypothetical protein
LHWPPAKPARVNRSTAWASSFFRGFYYKINFYLFT